MRFNIFLNDETILEAAALCELHYIEPGFLNSLCSVESFNFTKDNGSDVADKIFNSELEINIRPYRTKLPWSKVIGYAKGNTIFVNTRKLDLSLEDRVCNLFHEYLHLLGYSHNGNRVSEFNNGTVPYKVSKMFSEFVMRKISNEPIN